MEHFDRIILLFPSFEWNKTYNEWKYKDDPHFIAIPRDQNYIHAVLKYVVDLFKRSNILTILDNCASGQ